MELCPADYDQIREESGHCTYTNGSKKSSADNENCIPDPSFGEPCTDFLGFQLKKKFCCKSDPKDCTWSGRWMGAMDSFNIYCRYDSTIGRCGKLDCSVNHRQFQGRNSSLIAGKHCDELEMWKMKGKATCGYIAWYDPDGNLVNSWYKTH
uniref:C-type lectin domain-containing protein n=1 Tax=Syphacia muris TaxID=451379 RepID=A0A0N5ATE5_9BILA